MPAQLTIALVWGFLLPFLAAFFSTALILWLYTLPMRRLPQDAHWSEVARCYWGIRAAKALSSIWIIMAACAFAYQESGERDELWMLAVVALAAIFGCTAGIRQAERGLRLPEDLRKRRGFGSKVSLSAALPRGSFHTGNHGSNLAAGPGNGIVCNHRNHVPDQRRADHGRISRPFAGVQAPATGCGS